jgi:hypothetical protein
MINLSKITASCQNIKELQTYIKKIVSKGIEPTKDGILILFYSNYQPLKSGPLSVVI